MKSLALCFAVMWVSISAIIFGFLTSAYIANVDSFGKEGLFAVFMSLVIMLIGVFMTLNYQKINLYLKNCKREKHI